MRKFLCKIGLHKYRPISDEIQKGLWYNYQLFKCVRCSEIESQIVGRHQDTSILETLPVESILKEHVSINYGVDENNYQDGSDFNLDLGLDLDEIEELIMWSECLYGVMLNLDQRKDTTRLSDLVKFIEDRK